MTAPHPQPALCGVLLLDKPCGISSNQALQQARRWLQADKAGHTGALDPLASGLLPLCIGEATKFSSFFLDGDKTYIAEGTLGIRTATLDGEGPVIARRDPGTAPERLSDVLGHFIGELSQIPPRYSAVKVGGRELYKYARAGREVAVPARRVTIYELRLLDQHQSRFTLQVHCSKGTYIRTLIDDIGQALGCGAYLSALRRTAVQGLPAAPLHSLEELRSCAAGGDLRARAALVLPLSCALASLPRLTLSRAQARRLCCGQRQELCSGAAAAAGELPSQPLYLECEGRFLGIGQICGTQLRALRMMRNPLMGIAP